MPRIFIAIFYLVAFSAADAQITSSINLDLPASRSEKSSQKTVPPKSQKITTTGLGATPSEAEKQALSEAVRQAVGALLDAKTLIENEEVIEDRILTVNNGFVKSYDVVAPARKNSDGVFEIKILAVIETSIVAQALQDAGIKGDMAGQNFWAESMTKSTNAEDSLILLEAKMPEYCKKLIKLQFIDANGAIASTNAPAKQTQYSDTIKATWYVRLSVESEFLGRIEFTRARYLPRRPQCAMQSKIFSPHLHHPEESDFLKSSYPVGLPRPILARSSACASPELLRKTTRKSTPLWPIRIKSALYGPENSTPTAQA